jgi:uncharacterized protein (TIGR02646 family)
LIRIIKPANAPAKLRDGVALSTELKRQRRADPESGASRQRAFKFDKKVYGNSAVKSALQRAQHEKCCYCEGYFAAHAPGDVEHFRPKVCVQQDHGEPIEYPGYYWLAYSWDNIFYSCLICNRSGKKNFFPLGDPTQRWTNPNDPPDCERPLLIDPSAIDPRDHIRFDGPMPRGITDVGKMTIRILKLDRGALKVDRLKHLKLLQAWRHLASLDPTQLDDPVREKRERAIEELRRAVEPDAVYSSMTIDYLAGAAV